MPVDRPRAICYRQIGAGTCSGAELLETRMAILAADDIRKIALLARLKLSDDEVETFAGQLDGILDHFMALQAVDTAGVEPTAHSVGGKNVTRPDVVRPSLTPEAVVANAPQAEANMFVVPQIVET
jgi:aspartyl-tRNA(Asn)/glutamyl-tRNA(Gln) amidotransferase subunit C